MRTGLPPAHPAGASGLGARRSRAWLMRAALLRDPRLGIDYTRSLLTAGRGLPPSSERMPQPGAMTPAQARRRLAETVGEWGAGPAIVAVRGRLAEPPARGGERGARMAGVMAGDTSLGELAYALVRAIRPAVVIETGVATGVTSAHVLAALADNDHGVLESIDLPPGDLVGTGLVGDAVPDELRSRWRYHWSTARRRLPALLEAHGGRGPRLFIHDSDHSYENMRWELETAWRALEPGDWVMADDVDLHDAFNDFAAAAAGSAPWVVAQEAKPGSTGMLRR